MPKEPTPRATTQYRSRTTPIVMLGAIVCGLIGSFAFCAGAIFLALTLIGKAPPSIKTFTIVFDLVLGSIFLGIGAFLAWLARRRVIVVESTTRLDLRNDRTHHEAALFAGTIFSVVGSAVFVYLTVAHVRGSTEISTTSAGYFFLEGLSLIFTLMMGGWAVLSSRSYFDRSIRLELDQQGLMHDSGMKVAWSEINDLSIALKKHKLSVIAAALCLEKDAGETLRVDIFALDQEPQIIFEVAKKLWKEASKRK